MLKLFDYTVEETGDKKAPYILYGKRGAVYGLLPYPNSDDRFYAINLSHRSRGIVTPLHGNTIIDKSWIKQTGENT